MKIRYPIDRFYKPIIIFIQREKSSGIILGISVLLALILANSPLSEKYFQFFEHTFGFEFDGKSYLNFNLLHWINDGLMAVFFFVIGLELKREIVAGELSNARKAILPIGAALGGMIFPALIYLLLNPTGETHNGWGIPMATDIAFALGILYFLGNRIPVSLKIFLTVLAVVDDLGAVLVIAFFYTSSISFYNLLLGLIFVLIMYSGNRLGVRNMYFYAFFGIIGVWTAFLLSGVHATIAAVIAAFTIPADVTIKEFSYIKKIQLALHKFKNIDPNGKPTLSHSQFKILNDIRRDTRLAIPPLQRLEHTLHPLVNFVILPIFALANAGFTIEIDWDKLLESHVALGVFSGLLFGKVIGVFGVSWLFIKFRIAPLPVGMNLRNLLGVSLLAAVGFTMSLFINSLAFTNPTYLWQAKFGIFGASLLGGILGYLILRTKPT